MQKNCFSIALFRICISFWFTPKKKTGDKEVSKHKKLDWQTDSELCSVAIKKESIKKKEEDGWMLYSNIVYNKGIIEKV